LRGDGANWKASIVTVTDAGTFWEDAKTAGGERASAGAPAEAPSPTRARKRQCFMA